MSLDIPEILASVDMVVGVVTSNTMHSYQQQIPASKANLNNLRPLPLKRTAHLFVGQLAACGRASGLY